MQMTDAEISLAESVIHKTSWCRPTRHAHHQMRTKSITLQDLQSALASGSLIEVSLTHRGPRALVRGLASDRDTCVVVSLKDKSVVTAWVNATHDQHVSLDKTDYTWETNLINLFQTLDTRSESVV
jgi:hypothetical protein